MNAHSDSKDKEYSIQEKLIGIGEHSFRKTYYPQLLEQMEYLEKKSEALLNMLEDLEETRKKLEESEERYRLIAENTADTISILDMELKPTYLSPSVFKLRGFTVEEALVLSLDQILPPESFKKAKNVLTEQLLFETSGKSDPSRTILLELEMYHKNGSIIWVEMSASFLRDENFIPQNILTVTRDITERKHAEEALLKSEAHYYQLFEDSPISLWEEDYSEVKKLIDQLKESGVTDLRSFFDNHPEEVLKCVDKMKVNSFNNASLELYKAEDKVSLLNGLSNATTDELLKYVKETFIALASGKFKFYGEATLKDFTGEIKNVVIRQSIAKEYENNWDKVIVSLIDITERKHAEEALQKSEALLNTTQQLTKVGGWEFDVKSGKMFWTEELYRIHEIPNDPNIDHIKESLTCYGSEDRLILQDAFQRACEQGEPYDFEFQFTTFTGKPLWIRTTAQPVYEEGKVVRLVGNLMDITESKLAEEALYLAAEEIRDLYNRAPCGYHSLDKNGVIVRMNHTELEWLGYTFDEVVGKMKFIDIITKESQEIFNKNFSVFMERGLINDLEFELVRKDGLVFPIMLNATALKDSNGNFIMSRSTVFDITERKKAEQKLINREREFRTLAENLPHHIMRYDINGNVTYLNHQNAVSNYSDTSIMGQRLIEHKFKNSEDVTKYQENLLKVLKTGNPIEMEIVFTDLNDNDNNYAVAFVAEHDSNGIIIGVLAIGQDITERKIIEQERQENLRYFESIDRINLAFQGTNNLEKMMSSVLNTMISIFNCDQVFLMYPCDPNIETLKVLIERTKPEYSGILESGLEIPMDTQVAGILRLLLSNNGPLQFGTNTSYPLPAEVSEQFGFKCLMSVAIYPKVGKPWLLGFHQSSYVRIWTKEEERLFNEIGKRLEDSLTSFIAYNNLKESEEYFRSLIENSSDVISLLDKNGDIIYESPSHESVLGYRHGELIGKSAFEFVHHEDIERIQKQFIGLLPKIGETEKVDFRFLHCDGNWRYLEGTGKNLFNVPSVNGIVINFRDVTERKRIEQELKEQIDEINRFNRLMVGREEKMIELKKEINALLEKEGKPKKYSVHS
ncbi:MAG: PAS domain S-box protein [Bacteroidetes bacterium]|nr:PAS domain S-box protein [Bacteroidota bacterium]MBU1114669.1 PAS domain S-box protein [Bacteroidota bacterium]MBU1798983.1 PAS domain S-box protein [Bacteroidota bacterium]